jgi:subtilase family serine protease
VQADNWQQVAESNEQNNDVSKTFFVSAPDLVMESVTGTSNLVAGQTAVFTVTVANRGTAPAGTSVLKTQIDGSQIDSRALPALQPGDVVVSTIPWTASAGGHTLLVEADNWQQVPESDETTITSRRHLMSLPPLIPSAPTSAGAGIPPSTP